jgi:broad specificity phosphatase PhoE
MNKQRSDPDRSASKLCSSILLFVSLFLLATLAEAKPPTIFLVRHAERSAISGRVPTETGLSREGQARAQSLARILKGAGITAIYTSEYRRTQETAGPLAKSVGIKPEVIPADDLRSLVTKLRTSRGNVLVVGHSNTLPSLLRALGVSDRITISESDYENLFEVTLGPRPRFVRRSYR